MESGSEQYTSSNVSRSTKAKGRRESTREWVSNALKNSANIAPF